MSLHVKTSPKNSISILPEDLDAGPQDKIKVAILGTCIAEALVSAFQRNGDDAEHYLVRPLNMPLAFEIGNGPYDAIVVHVTLRRIINNVVGENDLIHVRPLADAEIQSLLEKFRKQMIGFVENVMANLDGSCPVFFLSIIEPPSTFQGILLNGRRNPLHYWVTKLNDTLTEALEARPGTHYLEVNDLVRFSGERQLTDLHTRHYTHAGSVGPALPDMLCQRIHDALEILHAKSPVKLIITDLDNTLWKGVLAEDADEYPSAHAYTEGWPIGYVEALLEFKRRGGLLAISSKNDRDLIEKRFVRLWRDRLRLDDFCSIKINWNEKSSNISEILSETNLLPSSVLFVDDNPRELEEVTRVFPEIRTLAPPQDQWRNVILYSPHTQVAVISPESSSRTESIRAKLSRDELASEMDREGYLRSLGLRVLLERIAAPSHERFARAAELVNKTNQFNTTGKRWDHSEFGQLFDEGGYLSIASGSDRFENSGVVAVCIVRGDTLEQFVLSCRVFGLGVETALLSHAVETLLTERPIVRALQRRTPRNHACTTFYARHGFCRNETTEVLEAARAPEWPAWIAKAD